jgi:hypothetical protein
MTGGRPSEPASVDLLKIYELGVAEAADRSLPCLDSAQTYMRFESSALALAGGRDSGPFPGPGEFPHIISRNLTPPRATEG